jgi:hypothetical protein
MTGPEHYGLAEKLLEVAGERETSSAAAAHLVAAAQVHATLAQAAATAMAARPKGMHPDHFEEWDLTAGIEELDAASG